MVSLLTALVVSLAPAASAAAPVPFQCRASDTQCDTQYSANGQGCCPMDGAVCCSNKQTCCPAGTKCVLDGTYLTTCVDSQGGNTTGLSLCKFGPYMPMSTTLKNVVFIGDSVSIGTTPHLQSYVGDIALVQHSPWDHSDGGAEETAYGLQCLPYLLASPDQKPIAPDLIIFNWGLHDGPLGNSTVPGQQGNASVYSGELRQIAERLNDFATKAGSKLVFALTTPVVCSIVQTGCVETLNNEARAIMTDLKIPILDQFTPVLDACGPLPQPACFGQTNCFCPHCPVAKSATWGSGYEYLVNTTIGPAVRAMLSSD
eukprot:Hpha_TRINITY_DN27811_c0_g1::TRINITY_DN27811_c0_g1_i1::g.194111::m.194111